MEDLRNKEPQKLSERIKQNLFALMFVIIRNKHVGNFLIVNPRQSFHYHPIVDKCFTNYKLLF